MMVQSLWGLLLDTFWIGLIFVKMAQPQKRSWTMVFSKRCCVSASGGDGRQRLTMRLGI